METKVEKCDNCGKPESSQAIVENGKDNWCLDCMRQAGLCVSCSRDIRLQVEDYYNYDDDVCPECTSIQFDKLKLGK